MGFIKKAFDIARKQVFFCDADEPLASVAKKMHSQNVGSILVMDGETLAGIITVNDMLRSIEKNRDMLNTRAKDTMSSPVVTVSKDIEIDSLVDMFNKHKVSRMVLLNKSNKIVGVVRDIAVYKYMTFYKFEKDVKKRWSRDYLNRLY